MSLVWYLTSYRDNKSCSNNYNITVISRLEIIIRSANVSHVQGNSNFSLCKYTDCRKLGVCYAITTLDFRCLMNIYALEIGSSFKFKLCTVYKCYTFTVLISTRRRRDVKFSMVFRASY